MRALFAVIAVVVFTLACGDSEDPQPEAWVGAELVAVSHPNGLVLELPQGLYLVETTAAGFRIRPKGAQRMRSPFEIRIEVGGESPPDGDWPQRRELRGHQVRFRLETHEGGSGGTEHVLHAWQTSGEAVLTLQQRVQFEGPGRPEFRDGWAVLATAHLQ
jgi:hypothetical protein